MLPQAGKGLIAHGRGPLERLVDGLWVASVDRLAVDRYEYGALGPLAGVAASILTAGFLHRFAAQDDPPFLS